MAVHESRQELGVDFKIRLLKSVNNPRTRPPSHRIGSLHFWSVNDLTDNNRRMWLFLSSKLRARDLVSTWVLDYGRMCYYLKSKHVFSRWQVLFHFMPPYLTIMNTNHWIVYRFDLHIIFNLPIKLLFKEF